MMGGHHAPPPPWLTVQEKPMWNRVNLQLDMQKFTKKLRLAEYNIDRQYIQVKMIALRNHQAQFAPNRGRDRVLDTYKDFLTLEHIQVTHRKLVWPIKN